MQQFCLTALTMLTLLPDSVEQIMACVRAPGSCVSQGPRRDGIIKIWFRMQGFCVMMREGTDILEKTPSTDCGGQ
jgi:hypothetical protein